MNHLHIDSITKYVGNKLLLSDIFFTCDTSEIVGILGSNGSGKSTLLKIIFGTLAAENKFIKINEEVLETPYKSSNAIAILPQVNFIPYNLAVKMVIRLYVSIGDREEFYRDDLIHQIKDRKVSNLSGGELKYLQVKLVLFLNSKFILLDEPFSGVSPLLIEKIKGEILKRSAGKGVIITDHNYREVCKLAHKLYLLREGKNHLIKDIDDLIKLKYLRN